VYLETAGKALRAGMQRPLAAATAPSCRWHPARYPSSLHCAVCNDRSPPLERQATRLPSTDLAVAVGLSEEKRSCLPQSFLFWN